MNTFFAAVLFSPTPLSLSRQLPSTERRKNMSEVRMCYESKGERDWSQIRRQLKNTVLFQSISSSTGYIRCGSGRHAEPIGFIIATITNHLARKGPPFPCQQRSAVFLPTKVRRFPANKGPPFPRQQRSAVSLPTKVRRFSAHKSPQFPCA
jgi:hypothetical protein